YMHDTPAKQLFERDDRAFSHGCIRVGDALGFATTLLEGVKTREEVDAIVATRKTTTVDLPASLPVYIAYFTAGTDNGGKLTLYSDIYGRDGRVGDIADPEQACGA
ncbi:MAG: L,D-transpeptidase family protein, partial [Novosphingobium sp.]|nr:L,D-transpeptidase family protein [Novosphingobium sp.]